MSPLHLCPFEIVAVQFAYDFDVRPLNVASSRWRKCQERGVSEKHIHPN
jgi:hypothetical protein